MNLPFELLMHRSLFCGAGQWLHDKADAAPPCCRAYVWVGRIRFRSPLEASALLQKATNASGSVGSKSKAPPEGEPAGLNQLGSQAGGTCSCQVKHPTGDSVNRSKKNLTVFAGPHTSVHWPWLTKTLLQAAPIFARLACRQANTRMVSSFADLQNLRTAGAQAARSCGVPCCCD